MYRVLVTDHPGTTTDLESNLLASVGARLVVAQTGSESELIGLVPDVEAILTCFRHVTPAVVRAGTRLRVISRYGVGVDNIAVDVASQQGIPVANVPVYCVDEVAEHAIALLMTLVRRTAIYDASIRAGRWDLSDGLPMHRLAGSTLGVVGFGHIGRAVVARARGLGMRVLVARHSEDEGTIAEAGVTIVTLDELLSSSDAVSIHVPLTPQTRHLIDARRLSMMRAGAFLINCARGAVVDLDALVRALSDGWLGGAGLDVFDPEKLPSDHPITKLRNVVLTPHVAFYSEESIVDVQRLATENVIAVLGGQAPHSLVNRAEMERHRR